MLLLGIILIVVAIGGALWGYFNMVSKSYSHPFASPEEVVEVCQSHVKPLGTSPGVACGAIVRDLDGNAKDCRKGTVNSLGNECVAEADSLSPGLFAGSCLTLVAGIVCCFLKEATHTKHEKTKAHHAKR